MKKCYTLEKPPHPPKDYMTSTKPKFQKSKKLNLFSFIWFHTTVLQRAPDHNSFGVVRWYPRDLVRTPLRNNDDDWRRRFWIGSSRFWSKLNEGWEIKRISRVRKMGVNNPFKKPFQSFWTNRFSGISLFKVVQGCTLYKDILYIFREC